MTISIFPVLALACGGQSVRPGINERFLCPRLDVDWHSSSWRGNHGRFWTSRHEVVEYIPRRCREKGLGNVEVTRADEPSARLPAGSVDLVFICDTYHHFEFPAALLANLRDALRPGGRMVIIDLERIPGTSPEWIIDHVRTGKAEVIEEIVAAGFVQSDEIDVAGLEEDQVILFGRP